MNDQPTGPAPATPEAAVEEGAAIFAQVEARLQKAQQWAGKLVPIFEAANDHGMMGGLQAGKMKAKARAIAGLAAQAEVLAWELHREATDIAVANGVDMPIIAGGGPR